MTDETLGNLGQWVSAAGTRRGALAALLAGAAGAQTAQGRNTGAGKHRRGKKGKKRKNTNNHGAGDASLPHVTFAIHQDPIPNQTGFISSSASCPAGSVPVGAVWTVENVHEATLIKETILLTQPPAWEVNVHVPTGSPNAIFEIIAICLDGTFTVVEE